MVLFLLFSIVDHGDLPYLNYNGILVCHTVHWCGFMQGNAHQAGIPVHRTKATASQCTQRVANRSPLLIPERLAWSWKMNQLPLEQIPLCTAPGVGLEKMDDLVDAPPVSSTRHREEHGTQSSQSSLLQHLPSLAASSGSHTVQNAHQEKHDEDPLDTSWVWVLG